MSNRVYWRAAALFRRNRSRKRERETPLLRCGDPTPPFNILRDALEEKNGPGRCLYIVSLTL
jgi:hypothetical protein